QARAAPCTPQSTAYAILSARLDAKWPGSQRPTRATARWQQASARWSAEEVHKESTMQPSQTPYDEDFYLWTQQQAALLREGKWQALDYANLAEEIESVGRSDKRELSNRLKVLVLHLLKWRYQPDVRQTGHSWADTIWEQRGQIVAILEDS